MTVRCPRCGGQCFEDLDPGFERVVCIMCSWYRLMNLRSAKWQAELERIRIESLANRKTGRPRKRQPEDQAG